MVLELFVVQLVDGAEDFEVRWCFHADVLENGVTYLNQVGDSLIDYKSSTCCNSGGGQGNPTGVGLKAFSSDVAEVLLPAGDLQECRISSIPLVFLR